MALAGTSKISYKHRSCGGWTINSLWNFNAVEVSSGKILRDGAGEGTDEGADEGVDDDPSFLLPCVFRTVLDEAAAAETETEEAAAPSSSSSISIIRVIMNSILNIRVSDWNK